MVVQDGTGLEEDIHVVGSGDHGVGLVVVDHVVAALVLTNEVEGVAEVLGGLVAGALEDGREGGGTVEAGEDAGIWEGSGRGGSETREGGTNELILGDLAIVEEERVVDEVDEAALK